MTYTITTHWHPGKRHDLNEPVTDTAPDWPTARTMALKLTTLRATAAVVVHDPDGELIANWDVYSNLWREPRPRPTINPTTVDRARILAAEYRDNPTPARAHNAAQTLWDILGTLDAVVARTFAITDENDRLTRVVDEARKLDLLPPRTPLTDASPLGKAAPRTVRPGLASIGIEDERQRPDWPPVDETAPMAEGCETARTTYHRTRCAAETCGRCWLGGPENWPKRPGFPIVTSPVEWCAAPGPTLGVVNLQCFLARGHEGDHSTNAHPNPRTWPPLATGGIVTPNPTHRIGES